VVTGTHLSQSVYILMFLLWNQI
jgi:hypothetical protein